MNTKIGRSPALTLAIALACAGFAGCSGGQNGLTPPTVAASQAQAQAQGQHHVAHPDSPAGSVYQMITPLYASIDGTNMSLASHNDRPTSRGACPVIATDSGRPVEVTASAEYTVSAAAVANFTCDAETSRATTTDYYIVMVTNPSAASTDTSAQMIAGPATQDGSTLTFPLRVKGISIEPGAPSYFFIASYKAEN
jgi:hypothetical protein